MSIDWVCGEAKLLSSVTTVKCADLRRDGDYISNILFSQSFIRGLLVDTIDRAFRGDFR